MRDLEATDLDQAKESDTGNIALSDRGIAESELTESPKQQQTARPIVQGIVVPVQDKVTKAGKHDDTDVVEAILDEDSDEDVYIEAIYPDPEPELVPRQTRVLAMINQKGGVGKTTTTANLGAALTNQGFNVLMIDLDPQAHLTLHVGLDPEELEGSVYELMTDDYTAATDVIYSINSHMSVIPAEVNLAGAESELAGAMASGKAQRMLKTKLAPIIQAAKEERLFDYVLIDCPPSLGLLTINALTLAGEVIVPMQAHFLALQGLSKLLETVALIRESFNPNLEMTGVILCMHEGQTILAQEVMNDLSSFFAESAEMKTPWSRTMIHTPAIRRNIKLAESPSFGKTIFDYAPYSNGARDYEKLAVSVSEQVINLEGRSAGSR